MTRRLIDPTFRRYLFASLLLVGCFAIGWAQGVVTPNPLPQGGTTLLDPLQLHAADVRTLPKYPAVGAWSLIVGGAAASPQGQGIWVKSAGQAIVYPTTELLSARQGTIEFWITAVNPATAGAPKRVLLDSWSAVGAGRWLLSLDGQQITLAMTGANKVVTTITGPANWLKNSSHRITLLWNTGAVILQVDGKEIGKIEKPILSGREPLAIALGNGTDFNTPADLIFSDLRLSTLSEATPPNLARLEDNTPNVELSLKMAQGYQRRLMPLLEVLRKQGVAEVAYFSALASSDIGDNERAMEQVTPITRNPKHPLYVQAIFLRADLLSNQHDYVGAREQLEVLVGADLSISVRAQVKQARIMYEEGNSADAKQLISEIIARYPDLKVVNDAYVMIGLDQFKAGNYQSAFSAFDSVGTSGSLARQSVAIGTPLQIKVADADLSVRLADVGLPITVTSDSGDKETVDLRPAFSRGVYLGAVMTGLGEAKANDGILQVQGANDKVHITYADRLSEDGTDVPRTVAVDLKTNATLLLVSQASLGTYREGLRYQKSGILEDNWTIADRLPDDASAFFRNPESGELLEIGDRLPRELLTRIKPGQGIYVEVTEPDADFTVKADTLEVTATTTTGKKKTLSLVETGPRTGIFSGVIKTTSLEQANDDALAVAINDQVRVTYSDPHIEAGTREQTRVAAIRVATELGSISCGMLVPVPNSETERFLIPLYRVAPKFTFTVQVVDRDLDISDAPEKLTVKLTSEDGMEATATLTELGEHAGIFRGTAQVGADPAATTPNLLKLQPGQRFTVSYFDEENPQGKPVSREFAMLLNKPENATLTLYRQVAQYPAPVVGGGGSGKDAPPPVVSWVETKQLVPGSLYRVVLVDPDVTFASRTNWSSPTNDLVMTLKLTSAKGAAGTDVQLRSGSSKPEDGMTFYGMFYVRLGDKESPTVTFASEVAARGKFGQLDTATVPVINVQGNDSVDVSFVEPLTASGQKDVSRKFKFNIIANAAITACTLQGKVVTEKIKPGTAFILQVEDAKGDLTPKRDTVTATLTSPIGDTVVAELTETDFHCGTFAATIKTVYGTAPLKRDAPKPAIPAKPAVNDAQDEDAVVATVKEYQLAVPFDSTVTASYQDKATIEGPAAVRTVELATKSSEEATGALLTKVYDDAKFEVETLVRLGESFYAVGAAEMVKNPQAPGKPVTNEKLQQAHWLFRRVIERFPTSEYVVESLYLSGKILCAELKRDEALTLFQRVIDEYPDSEFVAEALYQKLLLYVDQEEIGTATETAVQLVSRFPKSTLVSDAFLRIAEYYYSKKEYRTAAGIYKRTMERFPDNPQIERIAYRVATSYYKAGSNDDPERIRETEAMRGLAIKAFLEFTETYPEHELTDDAYYWAAMALNKQNEAFSAMKVLRRMIIETPSDADYRKFGLRMYNDLKRQYPNYANSLE